MRSQLVWVREGFARGPMLGKLRTRRGAVRGWWWKMREVEMAAAAHVTFAVAAAAAHFGVVHARASKGGGREPKVRPGACCERSEQNVILAKASKGGGREPKVRPAASCERSNVPCNDKGPRQAEALCRCMEPGGFAPPSRYVLPIASTSVFVLSISPRSSAHDERQTSASLAVVSFLCGQAALWNQPGF